MRVHVHVCGCVHLCHRKFEYVQQQDMYVYLNQEGFRRFSGIVLIICLNLIICIIILSVLSTCYVHSSKYTLVQIKCKSVSVCVCVCASVCVFLS